tara:strand:+ start:50 stop:850 length:801 start_codon:yes stop_codon:yes gene_type:complete
MSEQKINFKNNFKGILLDLEGVIYEGSRLIDGSIETINKLLAHGFNIKYLTNTTTTSRRLVFEKLIQFKLPLIEPDIFSPAIAANIFLKKKNISRISLFTNQSLQEDFADFVIDDLRPDAIILGDLYKEFSWEKLNKAFQIILEANPLIIALHKNRYCKRENKLGLDLGPFVAALEYATSKKSVLIGKPEKNFFNLAIEDMKLKNEEVVMIGDDIFADIGGAKNIFLSTIQVKTGKFQKKDETNVYLQPDYRINSISELPHILGME